MSLSNMKYNPLGFAPVLPPMQPYNFPPILPPFMPPPPIQPQSTLPIPPHGDGFYGGAALPQQQNNFQIHQLPQQQQQHCVRGVEARVDYTAAVMQATENAHAGRH
ncbi:hypothetical protein PAXRUDRAFT_21278 [Paxillus rubicundulus Ve08.2h10]|uniref:Uncharacterized protein n=1 Tax=Paxillus rubicundulus Ve08.2h10 TaxID=930991 RepID=A0A0D0D7S9_9AGAM|nr:hypothetical protein PAXRUDRAFT_21278 [Paxillus rubicundulus Ve08.2h10]